MTTANFSRQLSDSSLIASGFPGFDGSWFNEAIQESKLQIMRIVRDAQPDESSLAQLETTLGLKPVTLDSKRGKELSQSLDASWRSARGIRAPQPVRPVQRKAQSSPNRQVQAQARPVAARMTFSECLMDFAGDVNVAIVSATVLASSVAVFSILAL